MRVVLLVLVLAACSPKTRGWSHTITAGAQFGEVSSAVVALEISAIAHGELPSRPPSGASPDGPPPRWWPPRTLGIAATASAGGTVDRDGASGFVAVGADYLPILYRSGTVVGIGGGVVLGGGAHDGLGGTGRLWFAVPAGRAGWVLGGMLRCQLLDEAGGCGPSLVLARMRLGGAQDR